MLLVSKLWGAHLDVMCQDIRPLHALSWFYLFVKIHPGPILWQIATTLWLWVQVLERELHL